MQFCRYISLLFVFDIKKGCKGTVLKGYPAAGSIGMHCDAPSKLVPSPIFQRHCRPALAAAAEAWCGWPLQESLSVGDQSDVCQ